MMKRLNFILLVLVLAVVALGGNAWGAGFWGLGITRTQIGSNSSGWGAGLVGVYDWVDTKLDEWFKGLYVVKQNANDQGAVGTPGTLAYIVNAAGGADITVKFTGDYNYTLTTAYSVPGSVTLELDNGAALSGAATFTVNPLRIRAQPDQKIFNSGAIPSFTVPCEVPLKWFNDSAQAVSAVASGSTLLIYGDYDVATYGVIAVTDKSIFIEGRSQGKDSAYVGARIINDGGDVINSSVVTFTGSAQRGEGVGLKNLYILHEGATSAAITFDDMIYSRVEKCNINLNNTGYSGIRYVDESFFSVIDQSKIQGFINSGVTIEGSGSEYVLRDCHISSTQASVTGIYTKAQGVHVLRGEVGVSGATAIGVHFYNVAGGGYSGGFVDGLLIENLAATSKGIVIDGATNPFSNIIIKDLRAALNSNLGTLVDFERSNYSKLIDPQISNTAGGGTLVAWGANANGCQFIGSYASAIAPISVNGAAVRATKTVTGTIQRSAVTNITTNANLRVVLSDGIDDLTPGFIPVHNGTAWNVWFSSLADDTADSYTPPKSMGMARILNNDEAGTYGIVSFNTAAGGAECEALGSGSNFEVTTGALAGNTGNDNKITFSAHTDGKVYLECRKGLSTNTVLFDCQAYGL